MATFTIEDTTGHMECICFKYDENAEAIHEDAIVKIKGKFEHSDRGNQIMAFEIEEIELNEEDARPSHLQLNVPSCEFDQQKLLRLNRILQSYRSIDEGCAPRHAVRRPPLPRGAAGHGRLGLAGYAKRAAGFVRTWRADCIESLLSLAWGLTSGQRFFSPIAHCGSQRCGSPVTCLRLPPLALRWSVLRVPLARCRSPNLAPGSLQFAGNDMRFAALLLVVFARK